MRQLGVFRGGESVPILCLYRRYTQETLASLDRPLVQAAALPAADTGSKEFLHATQGHSLGPLTYEDVFGNVAKFHADPLLAGSLFQVASQFNVLEMVSPDVGPDAGVTGYQHDRTQGPACAMSCPAGTVFRCSGSSASQLDASHLAPRCWYVTR